MRIGISVCSSLALPYLGLCFPGLYARATPTLRPLRG